MAKGKKSSGNGYTSKGQHRNVSSATLRLMRAGKSEADKLLDKQRAWLKGSNPWVTIDNPNKEQTNKRRIRVRMNDLMRGSAKDREKNMYIMK
jgi:hypothetical protein